MPPSAPPAIDPYASLRIAGFRRYALGYSVSVIGRQMVSIAVGYELYQRTNSSTVLGLVGLAGALPVILLALPAGQVADRWNRKRILVLTSFLSALASLGLAILSLAYGRVPEVGILAASVRGLAAIAHQFGEGDGVVFDPSVPLMLALLFLIGSARAFAWAARGAFIANLVPRNLLASAVTWNSSNFQISSMIGPAIGGVLIAQFGVASAYFLDAICGLIFIGAILPIRHRQEPAPKHDRPLRELFSGLRFVRSTKPILATITLDLFAVLLGGATALLPIFAEKILHVGASGLGWLRAAPSLGALLTGIAIAHLPPMRRAGRSLLIAVAGFGAVMIVFGLSKSFALSFAALLCSGALDNISVVVRHTLVQLMTPDAMRGRVSAVNNIFIGSSNELGAFESGLTAAMWGPIASVVVGGLGTIVAVGCVAAIWPEIRRL
ncbi:MAG: MFS transporter, partial [Chthoniobacteraceae bacterium]